MICIDQSSKNKRRKILERKRVIIFLSSLMGSIVISIPADADQLALPKNIGEKEEPKLSIFATIVSNLRKLQKSEQDMRKLLHSVKVAIALVLVSLLYLLDPLYKQVGENAMWAIMTVVVIFEFYAGWTATSLVSLITTLKLIMF